MINKQDIFESENYRRWIASLPCLITGRNNVQCAHIRKGWDAGTGRKPPDYRTVPLSVEEHAKQHHIGELKYWYNYGGYETAAALAYRLYEVKFNHPAAIKLIEEYRARFVQRGAATRRHKFVDERGNHEENN